MEYTSWGDPGAASAENDEEMSAEVDAEVYAEVGTGVCGNAFSFSSEDEN